MMRTTTTTQTSQPSQTSDRTRPCPASPRGTVPAARSADTPLLRHARAALRELFGAPESRPFTVRYWDGTEDEGTGPALADAPGRRAGLTLVVRSPGALRRAFLVPSELALAEAYLRGDIDLDGDIEIAAAFADAAASRLSSARVIARAARHLLALPHDAAHEATRSRARGLALRGWRHSRARDRAAVRAHYNLGNEFYALWLDRDLVYSCAYFPTGRESIDEAQAAKLDLLCRKLRLRPGERLLDIGCGWGALIRHAARHYGVSALGITLSERQAEIARRRIHDERLDDRCRVDICDYRELRCDEPFDKVVSVGMFEHVGRSRLAEYFRAAARLTKPGGLFLNHGIVRLRRAHGALATVLRRLVWREGAFISRYVFPDGELVPLDTAVRCAEQAGFETRDVESLREHYAQTLRRWVQRLEQARAAAESLVGEQVFRVWRLYMAASAHAFASADIGLAQVLFARPDAMGRAAVPRTRADLYADRAPVVARA